MNVCEVLLVLVVCVVYTVGMEKYSIAMHITALMLSKSENSPVSILPVMVKNHEYLNELAA